jgi:hypothetical protein
MLFGALIPVVLATFVASAGLFLFPAAAKEHRSREVTREFQREQPCPSTGERRGRCPGYIKDHIVPLACDGPDAVGNMHWQTVAAAKAKDRWERGTCGQSRSKR